MKNKDFFCPIPICSLSIEAGNKRRLCCHDLTNETVNYTIDEINSGLRNTELSQKILKSYSKGTIPINCQSCFNLEEKNITSPRLEYLEKFPKIKIDTVNTLINYIDITVDNNCNLKCRSCKPMYSNGLTSDFEKLNIPFDKKIIKAVLDFDVEELNNIIPNISHDAHITLTGGEPFLSKKTEDFVHNLIESQNTKNISIRFFTNLTFIPAWFMDIAKQFKSIEVLISIDAVNDLTTYIRYPSKWNTIKLNLKSLCSFIEHRENISLRVHTVIQAYNFKSLMPIIEELKEFESFFPFIPEFTVLAHPKLLRAEVLPKDIFNFTKTKILDHISDISKGLKKGKFFNDNVQMLENFKRHINSMESINENSEYIRFLVHTKKFDNLRNQNFLDYMPELAKQEE